MSYPAVNCPVGLWIFVGSQHPQDSVAEGWGAHIHTVQQNIQLYNDFCSLGALSLLVSFDNLRSHREREGEWPFLIPPLQATHDFAEHCQSLQASSFLCCKVLIYCAISPMGAMSYFKHSPSLYKLFNFYYILLMRKTRTAHNVHKYT